MGSMLYKLLPENIDVIYYNDTDVDGWADGDVDLFFVGFYT